MQAHSRLISYLGAPDVSASPILLTAIPFAYGTFVPAWAPILLCTVGGKRSIIFARLESLFCRYRCLSVPLVARDAAHPRLELSTVQTSFRQEQSVAIHQLSSAPHLVDGNREFIAAFTLWLLVRTARAFAAPPLHTAPREHRTPGYQ